MTQVAAEACTAVGAVHQQLEPYPVREVSVGPIRVQRALPLRGRRLIGPWCFLDRFGPLTFNEGTPMDVAPHPHMGLQTVTWLQQGELVHHDSLLSEGSLRPGAVNVMTSGHAIAHAERTPKNNTGKLGGVQLWTALPDRDRDGPASFQHVPEVPVIETSGGLAYVFAGSLWSATSPAKHFSPLVGADLQVHARHSLTIPIEREHEHAVLILSGDCTLEKQTLAPGVLYYLGTQRTGPDLWFGRGRAHIADRWRSVSGNDPDVVELCCADARRNSYCPGRLGSASTVRRRSGLSGTPPSRPRTDSTRATESRELSVSGVA